MSTQVKRRREAATFLATYTGAQGELLVDTTNNRIQVHDGVTPGGWAAAKLSEVAVFSRTAVADAAYTVVASDRTIAFTALTAARIVTLSASSAYPTGFALTIFDESGSASATRTITVSAAGTDKIDGASSAVISSAYGYLALQNNGAGKWTIVDQAMSNLGPVGIGTAADSNNPLSVYGASALFNSPASFSFTINKAAPANTASIIFEDNFSAHAQIGLCGDDNFRFKVSANGTTFYDALDIASATGQITAPFGLVSSTIDNCVIGGTTLAAATVTSLNGGPLAGPRNLIINGNFAINQRGYVSGTSYASGYNFHDRWETANGASYTFTQAGGNDPAPGRAVDTAIALGGNNLLQIIEGRHIVGGSYVLSYVGNCSAYVQYYTTSGYVVVGSGAASPIVTSSIPAGASVMVVFNAPGTNLSQIQLERGTTPTPFERRLYGHELSLCQRYYQRLNGAPYRRFGIGIATSSTIANIMLTGQCGMMRVAPTFSTSGSLCLYNGSTVFPATAISLDTYDPQQVGVNVAVASGLTAGASLLLCGNNDSTAQINLSAEI